MPEQIDVLTGEITNAPPSPYKTPEPAQGALSPPAAPWSGARRQHARVQFSTVGPSLAKQSYSRECDINFIMKKFEKTGVIEHLNKYEGKYGNFIAFQDYHTSQNLILDASEAFNTIPASIRAKFDNDPAIFLEFAQNPENLDQMIELGLAPPKVPRDRYAPKDGQPPTKPPAKPATTPEAPEKPGKPSPDPDADLGKGVSDRK